MPNPYTQDITPTVKAIQKSQKPSLSTSLLGLFQTYVQKENDIAKKNLEILANDFIPEKQKINNSIKQYNKLLGIQEDIEQNYGGNIRNYAEAQVLKQYNQSVANSFAIQGKDGVGIINDNTGTTSKDFLKSRTDNYERNLQELFKTAKAIDISKDAGADYVDKLFTNEINKLPSLERQNAWDMLGNIVSGQGLNISKDYDTTRADILNRVYSTIPNKELGMLGDQFKTLYTMDPALAKQFEEEIVPNIEVGSDINRVSNVREVDIQGIKRRVLETYTTYVDKNGQFQTTKPVTKMLSEDEVPIDPEKMTTWINNYSDKGQKAFRELALQGKKIHEIIETLNSDPSNYKDTSAEAIKNNYYLPQNLKAITDSYNAWKVANKFATIESSPLTGTQVIDIEGASEKKGYLTELQYRDMLANQAVKAAGGTITYEDKTEKVIDPTTEETVGYNINSTMFETSLFKQSMEGKNKNIISSKNNQVVSLPIYIEESLGIDNPNLAENLEKEFKNKDYSRVNRAGVWFNKDNPLVMGEAEQEALGFDDIDGPIELGWNVKDETFTFRKVNKMLRQQGGLDLDWKAKENQRKIDKLQDMVNKGYRIRPFTPRNQYDNPENQIQLSQKNIDELQDQIKGLEKENENILLGKNTSFAPYPYQKGDSPSVRLLNRAQSRLEELESEATLDRYSLNDADFKRKELEIQQKISNATSERNSLLGRTSNNNVGQLNKLTMAESSNNPDALWKQSQRNEFKDFKATESTMDEVLDFVKLDGPYAKWSKGQSTKNEIHTPVGKYQFVGATLRDIKDRGGFEDIGITGDTLFTPEVQDQLFVWYINDTIRAAGKDASPAKVRGMIRKRWEGATEKNISDRELDELIKAVQSGTYT